MNSSQRALDSKVLMWTMLLAFVKVTRTWCGIVSCQKFTFSDVWDSPKSSLLLYRCNSRLMFQQQGYPFGHPLFCVLRIRKVYNDLYANNFLSAEKNLAGWDSSGVMLFNNSSQDSSTKLALGKWLSEACSHWWVWSPEIFMSEWWQFLWYLSHM